MAVLSTVVNKVGERSEGEKGAMVWQPDIEEMLY